MAKELEGKTILELDTLGVIDKNGYLVLGTTDGPKGYRPYKLRINKLMDAIANTVVSQLNSQVFFPSQYKAFPVLSYPGTIDDSNFNGLYIGYFKPDQNFKLTSYTVNLITPADVGTITFKLYNITDGVEVANSELVMNTLDKYSERAFTTPIELSDNKYYSFILTEVNGSTIEGINIILNLTI